MSTLPKVPEHDNRFSFTYKGVKFGAVIPGDPRDVDYNVLVKKTMDSNFGERHHSEELSMEEVAYVRRKPINSPNYVREA